MRYVEKKRISITWEVKSGKNLLGNVKSDLPFTGAKVNASTLHTCYLFHNFGCCSIESEKKKKMQRFEAQRVERADSFPYRKICGPTAGQPRKKQTAARNADSRQRFSSSRFSLDGEKKNSPSPGVAISPTPTIDDRHRRRRRHKYGIWGTMIYTLWIFMQIHSLSRVIKKRTKRKNKKRKKIKVRCN